MTYEEYKITKPVIEDVALRLMKHENKDGAKAGLPFTNYCEINYQERRFFCVMSNVFLAFFKDYILKSQYIYPQNFGTGNAEDVLKALYELEKPCEFEDYIGFLSREQFAYIFEYKNEIKTDKILRIDLYRHIKLNKATNLPEFIGGIFHAFKHFSVNGRNLSTGKEVFDLKSPMELIVKTTIAFFTIRGESSKQKKYEVRQEIDEKYCLKYAFHCEPTTENIYFIDTIYKEPKK